MKACLIVLVTALLVAAIAAGGVSNSIPSQMPSVAATPVCNAGDTGCVGTDRTGDWRHKFAFRHRQFSRSSGRFSPRPLQWRPDRRHDHAGDLSDHRL
jgi:hypothetical protein